MREEIHKLHLSIPREHDCFEGHFPGDPLVPGALMIQWLAELIQNALPADTLSTLKVMKFISPVRPGDQCEVLLKRKDQKLMVECSIAGQPSLQGQFIVTPHG